jgi:hypothetical protein
MAKTADGSDRFVASSPIAHQHEFFVGIKFDRSNRSMDHHDSSVEKILYVLDEHVHEFDDN